MDKLIKALDEEQRIALARVVSDLVRADKVIDDSEIDMFNSMFGHQYKREIFLKAQQLSLSEALQALSKPLDNDSDSYGVRVRNRDKRQEHARTTLKAVKDVAIGDGVCDPTEAYLILAIDYFLNNNDDKSNTVYSLKMRPPFFMGQRFAIYVERTYDDKINTLIKENCRVISHLLSSIGYQFLYIPEIRELYESKGIANFKDTAMYLFPTIPEDKVEEAYNNICKMRTQDFVKDILMGKIGLPLNLIKPSFLFMFETSEVIGKDENDGLTTRRYADFISVGIKDKDPRGTIDKYINDFTDIVSYTQFLNFNPRHDRLEYQGVFKLFFNLIARSEEMVSAINVNIKSTIGKIYINDIMLNLDARLSSLYVLLIICSLKGTGLPNLSKDSSEEEKIHYDNMYRKIYEYMTGKTGRLKSTSIFNRLSQSICQIHEEFEMNLKGLYSALRMGRKGKRSDRYFTKLSPDSVLLDGCKIMDSTLVASLFEPDRAEE